jgi:hypothetical protein
MTDVQTPLVSSGTPVPADKPDPRAELAARRAKLDEEEAALAKAEEEEKVEAGSDDDHIAGLLAGLRIQAGNNELAHVKAFIDKIRGRNKDGDTEPSDKPVEPSPLPSPLPSEPFGHPVASGGAPTG